jgi:Kinesin motor domain
MVESASINKSLFVLAQCVEAISKKHSRIPYRESKMTRILSLGQNNGFTVMILNLAPVRSYHLDTLSSLNFANRTKKIEVKEIENEPIFKGPVAKPSVALGGPLLNRQPLRQIAAVHSSYNKNNTKPTDKPITKAFSVFPDNSRHYVTVTSNDARLTSLKRHLEPPRQALSGRANKFPRTVEKSHPGLTKADIEELIERRLEQKLAEKALNEKIAPAQDLPPDLQKRLNALEERVSQKEDSEGLQYLLMAKQHQARGEDVSALRMYRLARPFFPTNEKLESKIAHLEHKTSSSHENRGLVAPEPANGDADYRDEHHEASEDDSFEPRKPKRRRVAKPAPFGDSNEPPTPRTEQLLRIINTRDVAQIKLLKGVGTKKAEAIVSSMMEMDEAENDVLVTGLVQLGGLRGVGVKTVENMRAGLAC